MRRWLIEDAGLIYLLISFVLLCLTVNAIMPKRAASPMAAPATYTFKVICTPETNGCDRWVIQAEPK
jgi:hypothetical protein